MSIHIESVLSHSPHEVRLNKLPADRQEIIIPQIPATFNQFLLVHELQLGELEDRAKEFIMEDRAWKQNSSLGYLATAAIHLKYGKRNTSRERDIASKEIFYEPL